MSDVKVELKAEFMPKLSDGKQSLFFFTYNVIISNYGIILYRTTLIIEIISFIIYY